MANTLPRLTATWQNLGRTRLACLATVPAEQVDDAVAVLALSEFVHDVLRLQPMLFAQWCSDGRIHSSDRTDALKQRATQLLTLSSEAELITALRQWRRDEMALIAWRDIAGHASVEETVKHLSLLADLCIQTTATWLTRDFEARFGVVTDAQGERLQLVVLGMGKLGGHELNFSSDIDLIFIYGDDGETPGPRKVEHREYFTRLGQRLIHILSTTTPDGIVFRIDMRLRPYGDSGPLVISLDALEEYYQDQGREWERFAAIKARAITGDSNTINRWRDILRPFVFRRYIDYGVLEAIRRLKSLIAQDLRRKARGDNIKLGAGGIREIEFIVQAHQLIRGGRDLQLREQALLPMLQQIGHAGLLPADEISDLRHAYLYLRKLENSLQEMRDEQTQILPADATQQAQLAAMMGYDDFDHLRLQLDRYRLRVHQIFLSVFGAPTPLTPEHEKNSPALQLWRNQLAHEAAVLLCVGLGFHDGEKVLTQLQQLRDANSTRVLSERGRQRLDALMPALIETCARAGERSDIALQRIVQLLYAIARRTAYLELLAENQTMLSHLVQLCQRSAFVAEQLLHYPILLDELLDSKSLYSAPQKTDMRADLQQALLRIDPNDLETLLDALREYRHANTLRLAAATLRDALDIGSVSQRLTDLAEVILHEVLELAWQQLSAKHGVPPNAQQERAFLIVAYGKFGGQELSFASDLDLVFLYDGDATAQTDGDKPIGLDQFYTRLAQRIVHLLSTRTAAGLLYEVDTRLRPSGNSGLLVSHWVAFESYQRQDAWTWEHQALVRARPVAGSEPLATRFQQLRASVLTQPRDATTLQQHIVSMRDKMRSALDKSRASLFDLKQGRGGIVDIEFLVQFFVLKHAMSLRSALRDSHSVSLLQALADRELLSSDDAQQLISCYKHYRELVNQLALDGQSTLINEPCLVEERQHITTIWQHYLG